MIDIVLTDEQYRQLSTADGPVRVRNPRGVEVGLLTPNDADAAPLTVTAEEVDELNRRMQKTNPRWFTTAEVLDRIKHLFPVSPHQPEKMSGSHRQSISDC